MQAKTKTEAKTEAGQMRVLVTDASRAGRCRPEHNDERWNTGSKIMHYPTLWNGLSHRLRLFECGLITALAFSVASSSRAQGNRFSHDPSGNVLVRSEAGAILPQITGQPQSQVVEPGHPASFSVVMADTRGLTFQWRFNGTDLPRETNDTLLLADVSSADEGSYTVVITSSSGAVTSSAARLLIDSDGDALADSWESANFGDLSRNPSADSDGDGVSNLREFVEGTDPTSLSSFRVRLSVRTAGGGGTVQVSPFRATYARGEVVTLTAVPSGPWSFAGWGGALVGAPNPATLELLNHREVIANFAMLPAPAGLIAWWRGETDASDLIGGHHGVFYSGDTASGPSITPSGLSGGAFTFDGSKHIRAPDAEELRPARFSFEVWVNPAVQSPGRQTIAASGSSTGANNQGWSLSLVDGYARFATQHQGLGPHHLDSRLPVPLNEWTHLAVTFDGSVKRLYVSGGQRSLETSANPAPVDYDPAAVPFTIGSDWATGAVSSPFTGLLDEASFYDRELTPEEVAAIWRAARTGKNDRQPYFTGPERLPAGVEGDPYTGDIRAVPGVPPLTFVLMSGALPPGLSMSESGALTGAPAREGDYRFTAAARDAAGLFTRQEFFLRVDRRTPPPAGMLAWWRGEPDQSGLAKDAAAGHDGAFYSGNAASAAPHAGDGKAGGAFSFANGGHVRVPASPAFSPAQLTLEAWVYPTAAPQGFQAVASQGSMPERGNTWYLGLENGCPVFLSRHMTGGDHVLRTGTALTLYEWTHLAASFNGAEKVLFINGKPAAVQTGFSPLLYSSGDAPVTIGADRSLDSVTDPFTGRIDEVTLYSRALSETEILAVVQAGAGGKSATGPPAAELTDAVTGLPFTHRFLFPEGTPPVSVSLISGAPPPGFTLSGDGLLSGVTGTAGSFSFTVRAMDAAGNTRDQTAFLRVFRPATRPEGLISWHRAENNAQDTIGGNHGTARGGAGYRPGRVGAAFSFNGSAASIEIPDSPSLRPASLTLEAWVTMDADTGTAMIMGKPVGTATGNSWYLYYSNGTLNGGVGNLNEFSILSAPWRPQPGRWHHVAFAFDDASRQGRLYLDGAPAASGPVNTPVGYDFRPVLIGRDSNFDAPEFPLTGAVDEAAVYNRALSDAEIAAIFSSGPAGKALPGGGDTEDRDGDGWPNLVEYALGTGPDSAGPRPEAAVFLNPDGSTQLMLPLVRDPARTDVTITVESSGDLLDWVPVAESVQGAPFTGIAEIAGEVPGTAPRTVTIIDPYAEPFGKGRGFLRIRASR
ncbi:MAG: hypothetical protein JWM59_1439 [Verrucomicrobiales bacterium]|nr:hypothetical protein [Verrucomicrobiales bacterium]